MIKETCYSHRKIKTNINSQISFEKVRRVIKFNQKVWLKAYINVKR